MAISTVYPVVATNSSGSSAASAAVTAIPAAPSAARGAAPSPNRLRAMVKSACMRCRTTGLSGHGVPGFLHRWYDDLYGHQHRLPNHDQWADQRDGVYLYCDLANAIGTGAASVPRQSPGRGQQDCPFGFCIRRRSGLGREPLLALNMPNGSTTSSHDTHQVRAPIHWRVARCLALRQKPR